MTPTFTTRAPYALIDDERTPLSTDPGGSTPRFPLVRRFDAITELMDEAIATYGFTSTQLSESREFLLGHALDESTVDEAGDDLRRRTLAAIGELRSALLASETGVAAIVGIDRNTVRSWRRDERDPYPATVRQLFELQSLVRVVDALEFPGGARAWLYGEGPQGATRLDVLKRPGGVKELSAELRPAFFTRAIPSTLPAADEFDDDDQAANHSVGHVRGSFAEPVVRIRKVP